MNKNHMYKVGGVLLSLLFIFSAYADSEQVHASHTYIIIPVLEINPKNPIEDQLVTITTVLTNKGNTNMSNVTISFNLNDVWIIDDMSVDVPARKSVQVSFKATLPVNPGQHQLKACPNRESLGDDGDQCQTFDFVVIDKSTIDVVIISPKEETILQDDATIKVISLGKNAQKIELYIQGQLIDIKYKTPFDFTFDTTKYKNGQYIIHAIAYYDSSGSMISSIMKYFIDNSESVMITVTPGQSQEVKTKVGQSVIIESDVTNQQPFKIPATLIVLVKNSSGFTEFLSWKENVIPVEKTLSMSQSWIPETRGEYTVEVFLWNTIEIAVPLTDLMKISIVVD